MLVAIDTGSRRPVKILRARPTRHFLFLLVRCRCGKKFGHRADRPTIVCYHCGRMAALRDLRSRRGLRNGRNVLKPAAFAARAKVAAAAKPAPAPRRRRMPVGPECEDELGREGGPPRGRGPSRAPDHRCSRQAAVREVDDSPGRMGG